jgi:WD40 repeat protein
VSGSADLTIRIWSTEKWMQLEEITKIESPVLSIAFSPDGKKIVSGTASGSRNLQIWSFEDVEVTN